MDNTKKYTDFDILAVVNAYHGLLEDYRRIHGKNISIPIPIETINSIKDRIKGLKEVLKIVPEEIQNQFVKRPRDLEKALLEKLKN